MGELRLNRSRAIVQQQWTRLGIRVLAASEGLSEGYKAGEGAVRLRTGR